MRTITHTHEQFDQVYYQTCQWMENVEHHLAQLCNLELMDLDTLQKKCNDCKVSLVDH